MRLNTKKMKKINKKGVFQQLQGLGIGLAGLVIVMAVVFLILSSVGANSTVAADANATAAVETITGAADDIPGWVPLIVIAVIGAILLGLVAMYRN